MNNRNKAAHPNGNIFYCTQAKILEILRGAMRSDHGASRDFEGISSLHEALKAAYDPENQE